MTVAFLRGGGGLHDILVEKSICDAFLCWGVRHSWKFEAPWWNWNLPAIGRHFHTVEKVVGKNTTRSHGVKVTELCWKSCWLWKSPSFSGNTSLYFHFYQITEEGSWNSLTLEELNRRQRISPILCFSLKVLKIELVEFSQRRQLTLNIRHELIWTEPTFRRNHSQWFSNYSRRNCHWKNNQSSLGVSVQNLSQNTLPTLLYLLFYLY